MAFLININFQNLLKNIINKFIKNRDKIITEKINCKIRKLNLTKKILFN